jgi:competence ComEA-like helix-hairpin-helix protein
MRYLDSPVVIPEAFGEKVPESMKLRRIGEILHRPGVLAAALCICLLLGFFLGNLRARSLSTGVTVVARGPAEEIVPAGSELVNINTADEELLQTLPGIGPALASRIVAYREEIGGFQHLYELTDVKGIGSSTYEALQGLITLAPTE